MRSNVRLNSLRSNFKDEESYRAKKQLILQQYQG